MEPEIFKYEDGRLIITAEAFTIKELHDIIKKFDMNAEPYLSYVDKMTKVGGAYHNMEREEKIETIIYDIVTTIGDFDTNEELLAPAIERLTTLRSSPIIAYYEEIQQEVHRSRMWLRDNPITDGKEGNITIRQRMIEKVGITLTNYKAAEKFAMEELEKKMRGKAKLGRY